jgi:type I restriction enzyme, S subunit
VTSVGDILELAYGKALKESDRDGGPVAVVGSGGVVGGHSTGITDAPTIVVGRKGSIGSVTWIDGPAWPIDTAYFVKPRREDLDQRWAYWMLKALGMESMNKSAAVPGLNRDDVYRLKVEVPSLGEQRRIASVLDHADALRDKRRQLLAHLDALALSVFSAMFASGDYPSRRLDELIDAGDRMNYGVVQPGEDVPDGVPLIRVSDLAGGVVDRSHLKHISPEVERSYTRSRVRGNEILVSSVGSIGTVSLVRPGDVGSNIARAITRVPISDEALRTYVATYLRTPTPQRYFVAELRTVAQPTLNVGQLAATRVPVPPCELQQLFARRLRAIQSSGQVVLRAGVSDGVLFDSLQSRAFRGEL